MKVKNLVAAFDKNKMKINQPKSANSFINVPGLVITTLRVKNKIIGWDVNGKQFLVKGRTILETFQAVETYVNKLKIK